MANYIITTDSNADLPAELIQKYNIPIIPQYYELDEIIYGDELNLSPTSFYEKMREGALPKSMANNPAVIHDVFQSLLDNGYSILHIAFSSSLSGSYNNVCMVANELLEEYPNATIKVLDSQNVSLGEALLVLYALQQQENGLSLEDNFNQCNEYKSHLNVVFTVDDLHHLHRGGRVSKTTAILGSMINVKPILCINSEGKLVPNGTVRGRKKSLNTLVSTLMELMVKTETTLYPVGIVHGDCIDDANYVAKQLKEKIGVEEILINDVSPSIGAHAGPGALGLCFYGEKKTLVNR